MSASQEDVIRAAQIELARREMDRRRQATAAPPPSPQEVPLGMDPMNPGGAAGARLQPPNREQDNVRGIGQNIRALVTGAVAEPIAGIAGLVEGLVRSIPGVPGGFDNAANTIERVRNFITIEPTTHAGQQIAQTVAKPFAAIDRFVDRSAEVLGRGNPIAATVIKTALLGGPMAFGARGVMNRRREIQTDIRNIEQGASELGIEFGRDVREQLAQAGGDATVPFRGESMGPVQAELRTAAAQAKQEVDTLYDNARVSYAEIDRANLRQLDARLGVALEGVEVRDMPRLNTMLGRLDEITQNPDLSRPVRLAEIENLRRSINRNRPSMDDVSQNRAMTEMKRAIDDFMDDMLHRDLIRGDPNALQAWRDARSANQSYRARFRDNTVLRQLIEQDVTVEQMRNWVLGSGRVGFAPQAASTVRALKNAIGEDSAAFNGLRAEAMFNFVEPLMRDTPDFRRFAQNYDNIIGNNKSLVDELSLESSTALTQLRRIADAVEETGAAPGFNIDVENALARVMFGHQISQAGLRVNLATSMIRLLRGSGTSERRAMLGNMLGYDPVMPLVPRASPAAASIFLAELEQSQDAVDDNLQPESN